jgi:hypothetical protein
LSRKIIGKSVNINDCSTFQHHQNGKSYVITCIDNPKINFRLCGQCPGATRSVYDQRTILKMSTGLPGTTPPLIKPEG